MKVMITGGRGFIGKSLAGYFASRGGVTVITPTRKELNLTDSVAVRDFMAGTRPDIVIHGAAVGGSRKTGYDAGSAGVFSDNLRMFLNVARGLSPGARLIQLGSGSEYDRRAYRPKMREEYFDENVPEDAYGFSKYAISRYIQNAENFVCLRLFGLFGKHEDYTFKFITNAVIKNLLGMPLVINQDVRFDYLYINDFFRIIEKFLVHPGRSRHYNVTPTRSVTLLEVAGLINEIAGTPSEIKVLNPGMNREYSGDNARLLSEFKDLVFTPYREAIAELYAYYKANLASLDTAAVKEDPYLRNCKKI